MAPAESLAPRRRLGHRLRSRAALEGGGRRGWLSVQRKLVGMALAGTVLTVGVGAIGISCQTIVDRDRATASTLAAARHADEAAAAGRDRLRGQVFEAVLGSLGHADTSQLVIEQETREAGRQLAAVLDSLQALPLSPALSKQIRGQRPAQDAFVDRSQEISALAYRNQDLVAEDIKGFEADYDRLTADHQQLSRQLAAQGLAAQSRADRVRTVAEWLLLLAALGAAGLLLALSLLISRSILRGLRRVGDVAVRIADGDLDARMPAAGHDEVASLGHAVNKMAASLQQMFTRMGVEAERDRFASQLTEAFEMADEETAAHRVVEQVMHSISPTTPMELLLADSSRAHLNPVAANPDVPTPGCPVESPFGCVAVRRGSPVTFPSSRALNACPKLRDRVGGAPLSATCVPVTFMGRALGVLHVTGPDGEVASRHHTEQLAILASQAGARIGTVRATSKAQLQASTDGLTGLTNRRTLESRTRALLHEGRALALVIADLDTFKRINDTFGHEGGDQALRLFARALQDNTRTGDLVCRYGGDEFVVVLPGLSSEQAAESVHRLQVALLGALATGGVPGFTASYGIVDSAAAGSVDELVRLADAALMTAKTDGRNRVVLHGAPASTAPAATQPPLPHSPVMDCKDRQSSVPNPARRLGSCPRPPNS